MVHQSNLVFDGDLGVSGGCWFLVGNIEVGFVQEPPARLVRASYCNAILFTRSRWTTSIIMATIPNGRTCRAEMKHDATDRQNHAQNTVASRWEFDIGIPTDYGSHIYTLNGNLSQPDARLVASRTPRPPDTRTARQSVQSIIGIPMM